jgi:hypothetical protein
MDSNNVAKIFSYEPKISQLGLGQVSMAVEK